MKSADIWHESQREMRETFGRIILKKERSRKSRAKKRECTVIETNPRGMDRLRIGISGKL
jgi:hypothetical protein